jgi:hypothetical protein
MDRNLALQLHPAWTVGTDRKTDNGKHTVDRKAPLDAMVTHPSMVTCCELLEHQGSFQHCFVSLPRMTFLLSPPLRECHISHKIKNKTKVTTYHKPEILN